MGHFAAFKSTNLSLGAPYQTDTWAGMKSSDLLASWSLGFSKSPNGLSCVGRVRVRSCMFLGTEKEQMRV